MLKIRNLSVGFGEKLILQDINLDINKGDILILFGPNGSGKTTLIKTIMGFAGYNLKRGQILFKDRKINNFTIEQRVKLGMGIMYQHPAKIRGVKLEQIANFLCKDKKRIEQLADRLSLEDHLQRDINLDFSGGEMKRSELFQILLQDPDFLLLDEPESGVDLENISIMGDVLNKYLEKKEKSALIITHSGYILDYIKAQRGCVLLGGKFFCIGNPKEMFETIRKQGYEKCKECICPQQN